MCGKSIYKLFAFGIFWKEQAGSQDLR